MMNPKSNLITCVFYFSTLFSCFGQIKTGEYDGGRMFLICDKSSNKISGYIKEIDGEGVVFSCSILFYGTLNNSLKANIFYYSNEENAKQKTGIIQFTGNGIVLIKTIETPLSCEHFLSLDKGESFEFTKSLPLKNVAWVDTTKTYLSTTPNDLGKTKMYLINHDLICVLATKDNWVLVEFAGKKRIRGWLKKSNVHIF